MTIPFTRRTLILAAGVVGSGAVAGCSTPSRSEYRGAVTSFNRAILFRDDARRSARNAAGAWGDGDWGETERLHSTSSYLYRRCADHAGEARAEASDCNELADDADDLAAYCSAMAGAMDTIADAADQYGKGNAEQGDDLYEAYEHARQDALPYPNPPERDVDSLGC